ncbi:TMV resistance protein N-like, partial [Trifolium medium]|nr:TMV resistance protein N-like [Trifolium medium]
LNNLPKRIYQLKSLKILILSGCLKIDKDIKQMESLTTLIPFSIIDEKHADDSHVLKNDVDTKSKGDPSRCDNQRDVDEASKRHVEILNQSEDADEKRALLNDVDVNRRLKICFAFDSSILKFI